MLSRREWMALTGAAGASLALDRRILAAQPRDLITKPIPSTGERIPVVGLGSSATFARVARSDDAAALTEVFRVLIDGGGTVFDTAPGYGASEELAGRIARELGVTDKVFWATKVNVAGRTGGKADPAAAREQLETSLARLGKKPIDLIQVHDMADVPTHLAALKELKREGRIRYLGVTSTRKPQYAEVEQVMRTEPLDFIEIDYSIANRSIEDVILPLAIERKIAVLVALPFGRASLFPRVADKPLPEWAGALGIGSWAQYFLKFLIGHPAVTAVIPSTSRPANMRDNLGAARGRIPDEAERRRMVAYFDSVAEPPARPGS